MIFKYKRINLKRKAHAFQREPICLLDFFNLDKSEPLCNDVLLVTVEFRGFVGLNPSPAISCQRPPEAVLIQCAIHLAACHRVALRPLFFCCPAALGGGDLHEGLRPCTIDSRLTIQFCHLAHDMYLICRYVFGLGFGLLPFP